jgi:hypothetical protein
MTYNSFFQLHIPKTGGTYFKRNILEKIKSELNNSEINIKNEETLGLHLCWFKPYIDEQTYIYTTLRDPVKRLINQFCHQAESAILKNKTEYKLEDINKTNFYKWLEKDINVYKNVQSKSLVYFNDDLNIYKKAKNLKWEKEDSPTIEHFMFDKDFINYEINKKELFDNIKRINFISKSEDFASITNQSNIIKKISSDLQINNKNYFLLKTFPNKIVEDIFSKLSKIEINNLYEYQDLDSEIYFSNIYTKY